MMKRILPFVLCVLLVLMSAVSVSAAESIAYVMDEVGYLYTDEVDMLNDEAGDLYEQYGVGVFFVYTMSEDLVDYDIELIVQDMNDYILMLENETSWYLHLGGCAAEIVTEDVKQALRDSYDDEMTYRAGVSTFLSEAGKVLSSVPVDTTDPTDSVITVGGEEVQPSSGYLYDGADLLSDAEETDILSKLNKVREAYLVDMAIVTLDGIPQGSIDQYIQQYFDNSDLGCGAQRDAVLFMIDMESRKFRILSNGAELGAAAISMDDIDSITEDITSDLSSGDYASAFTAFIDACEYQINGYINGFPFDYGMNLVICCGIGLVIGLIVSGVMKAQLKTVRSRSEAADYVKTDSMSVVTSRDTFLYSTVTYTEKATRNSDSSGGGSSRNVGGGSF